MTIERLKRRHFLAALGAAGALMGSRALGDLGNAAAAGPSAGTRPQASTRRGPLRFVAVYTPHGRARELWLPRDGFDLRFEDAILRPLDDPGVTGRSFRDRLLVLDGIDLAAGINVGTSGHDGPRVILTGSGADGKGPSLDQFLAVDRGLGSDTLHTSIALGVGNDQTAISSCISYGSGGIPLPKWIDPSQTFAELFGGPLAGDRTSEVEERRRMGKSVLDVVHADLARLSTRVPASERTKMEQHQAALRDIEKRLSGVDRSCAAPFPPERARFPHVGASDGGAPNLDAITDLQIDLLARAFSCDLTRFATLMLGDLSHTHLVPELPDDVHSDVAHRYDARLDARIDRGEHRTGTPATWHALGIQNRYSYSKVARLLMRLDEAGVLDDTIVLVSGDMGDPARHSSRDVPTVLAGGCGGAFRMGRTVDLRREPGGDGLPNNRILVSIAQTFGVEIDRFGHSADPGIITGALPSRLAGGDRRKGERERRQGAKPPEVREAHPEDFAAASRLSLSHNLFAQPAGGRVMRCGCESCDRNGARSLLIVRWQRHKPGRRRIEVAQADPVARPRRGPLRGPARAPRRAPTAGRCSTLPKLRASLAG